MTTHAVKYKHHRGFIGDDDSRSILVIFAVTEC